MPDTDILEFSATNSDSGKAMQIANAVAQAYIAFRAQLSGSQVQATIQRLESTIGKLQSGSAQRTQAQTELNRLQLLAGANSSDAVLVQRAGSADKVSPAPAKDSILGFSIGLIIALIVVAVREAVDTTVRTESDIEDVLAAPVLVSVRSLPRRAQFVTMGRYEAMFADTYALLAAQVSPAEDSDRGLILAVTSVLAREARRQRQPTLRWPPLSGARTCCSRTSTSAGRPCHACLRYPNPRPGRYNCSKGLLTLTMPSGMSRLTDLSRACSGAEPVGRRAPVSARARPPPQPRGALASRGIELRMAGAGPMEAEVSAARDIHYRGWLGGQDRLRFLLGCDFGVVPSLWEEPGIPFALCEWLETRRPVLCTTRGGLAEAAELPGVKSFPETPEGLIVAVDELRSGTDWSDLLARVPEVSDDRQVQRWLDEHEAVYELARERHQTRLTG